MNEFPIPKFVAFYMNYKRELETITKDYLGDDFADGFEAAKFVGASRNLHRDFPLIYVAAIDSDSVQSFETIIMPRHIHAYRVT